MTDLYVDAVALTHVADGLAEAGGKLTFGSEMSAGADDALGADVVVAAFRDAVGQQQRRADLAIADLAALRSFPTTAMREFAQTEARLAGVAHGYVP